MKIEKRDKNNEKNGFTLIELIVVVAILGILAIVLIPVFNGMTERASAQVCEFNMAQLNEMYYTETIIDRKRPADIMLKTAAINVRGDSDGQKVTGVCPNGGTYTVVFASDGHTIQSITCDKHKKAAVTTLNDMDKLSLALKDPDTALYKYINSLPISARGSLDYPLPEGMTGLGGWSDKVRQLASDAGINIDNGSWRIYKWPSGDFSLYYTDVNVLEKNVGDLVDIWKWNVNGDGKTYIGRGKVDQKSGGGKTFQIVPALTNEQMSVQSEPDD